MERRPLFAIGMLEGKVITNCLPCHRNLEWICFGPQIDEQTPGFDIHLIADKCGTHLNVGPWLTRIPTSTGTGIHISTSCSWANVIERSFRDLIVRRVRRCSFVSVKKLREAIYDYIDHYNDSLDRSSGRPKQTTKSVARALHLIGHEVV
jgi:putative transposase